MKKYQKAHLCKHINRTGNVLVFIKNTCPMWRRTVDYVLKATCRECEYFELNGGEKEC